MSRASLYLSIAGAACLALFVGALIHLILLRYQRGDLYAPSSTLRSDPLGSRVFYEALPQAGDYDVARGYVPLARQLARKPATLFFLGLDARALAQFDPDEVALLGKYVWNGGRVVITLAPTQQGEYPPVEPAKTPSSSKPEVEPTPIPEPPGLPRSEQEKLEREQFHKEQQEEQKLDPDRFVPDTFHPSVMARWGFGWDVTGEKKRERSDQAGTTDHPATTEYSSHDDVLAVRTHPLRTEDKVPWESPAFFLRLDPAWQVDYRAKDRPVLIERSWGRGEIIIASDSYFISNEALRDDRAPRLLSWIAGPSGRVLFDETHLGTQQQDSIMVLIRRYHFEGVAYGLVLVTVLFLWRQSVPLVPVPPSATGNMAGGVISGKDSRHGLVNLLRRNIAPRDILSTCAAEWRRSGGANSIERSEQMESILAAMSSTAASEELVSVYRKLCEANTAGRPAKIYASQS